MSTSSTVIAKAEVCKPLAMTEASGREDESFILPKAEEEEPVSRLAALRLLAPLVKFSVQVSPRRRLSSMTRSQPWQHARRGIVSAESSLF